MGGAILQFDLILLPLTLFIYLRFKSWCWRLRICRASSSNAVNKENQYLKFSRGNYRSCGPTVPVFHHEDAGSRLLKNIMSSICRNCSAALVKNITLWTMNGKAAGLKWHFFQRNIR